MGEKVNFFFFGNQFYPMWLWLILVPVVLVNTTTQVQINRVQYLVSKNVDFSAKR